MAEGIKAMALTMLRKNFFCRIKSANSFETSYGQDTRSNNAKQARNR